MGLGVDGAAGRDQRRHVGDGVVDAVPVAERGDRERLIQVAGALGVDREQRDVAAVGAGPRLAVGGRGGLRLDGGREGAGDLQLDADAVESRGQIGRGRAQAQRQGWHRGSG